MYRYLVIALLVATTLQAAEKLEPADIKFALYSSGWGENTDDGLRLVVNNRTEKSVRLNAIEFLSSSEDYDPVRITFDLNVPASAYAETEIDYVDLLGGDECIERTIAENWKLVEISNYTLNPSVRNLIIEDTASFRIYQCVKSVRIQWTDLASNQETLIEEWVLFHFETRRDF